jgi:hypothetical protein
VWKEVRERDDVWPVCPIAAVVHTVAQAACLGCCASGWLLQLLAVPYLLLSLLLLLLLLLRLLAVLYRLLPTLLLLLLGLLFDGLLKQLLPSR